MARPRSLRVLILLLVMDVCACINDEGMALLRFKERVEMDPYGALSNWDGSTHDPCLWFGVECSEGKVVSLNLSDLCLKGTLAPELGKLIHLKSLMLQNNVYYGIIPGEIGELRKLEVLDLGQNNFSGPFPPDLGNILSLELLVIKGNKYKGSIPQDLNDLSIHFEVQSSEDLSYSERKCLARLDGNIIKRKLLQVGGEDRIWHSSRSVKKNNVKIRPFSVTALPPSPMASDAAPTLAPSHPPTTISPSSIKSAPSLPPSSRIEFPAPTPSPSPTAQPPSPVVEPKVHVEPPRIIQTPSPSKNPRAVPVGSRGKGVKSWIIYTPIVVGVSILLALAAFYLLCCRASNVVTVRPWATGLSGQLQKAFVTGVPALKRSEVELACEDFSNVIGSISDCKLYKGTLSSGVEIAVVSTLITSAKDWSKESESQFRKKISVLSKVNHKNFVNLLGFCEEQEPFTRMMVFEYAPNGTLFEHLHIKEAEDLDWATRLRIAMGIAYCLEYMHQLTPPVILKNLDSSTIYLTDDYASKVGDIRFWNEFKEAESQSDDKEHIVYRFGMLMLEILSGKLPLSEKTGMLEPWVSYYLYGTMSIRDLIDPTIGSFREDDVRALLEVIRSCIDPEPKERPTMAQVAAKLKVITSMTPDRATPKISPLWWAEIEIISSEAN